MITRLIVTLMLAVSSIGMSAADEPLSFKGLALGSSKKNILKHYPRADCSSATSCIIFDTDPKAAKGMSVAGIPAGAIFFTLVGGKLEAIHIMFESAHFNKVASALKGRYGDPDVQLPRGGEALMWRRPDGIIRLDQNAGPDRRDSTLLYSTDAEVRRITERLELRRNKAANDL